MVQPVIIQPYDPDWKRCYQVEETAIQAQIGQHIRAITHVGSTAVPGLAAKPIIDIMVGVDRLAEALACIAPLQHLDYTYHPEYESLMPERRYFTRQNLGLDTHHLHLVELTSEFWDRHLVFRDYLRNHAEIARRYEALKLKLAEQFKFQRHVYTDAKTKFIETVIRQARAETGQVESSGT